MFHRVPQKPASGVQVTPSTSNQPSDPDQAKESKIPAYLSSVCRTYFTISNRTLNKLVCLCGGRNAKYMLHRVYTLKYFQSLPDPAANLCDKCKDTRIWANTVGGEVFGVREAIFSTIKPWNVPQFGITFRYRNDPKKPSSSAVASPAVIYYCEHKKSPEQSETGGESTEDLLRKQIKDKSVVLVRFETPPPKPRYTPPPPPPEPPRRAPATPYTQGTPYERSTGKGIFGPRRLNPQNVVPFTSNGRPVISLDHLMPEEPRRLPFPNIHVRVRFDPRTSEPLPGGLPDLDVQPLATIPDFEPIPIEGVLPYKLQQQYCQCWDPATYIVYSMDDYDPGLIWLRRNGVSKEAALRPRPLGFNKTLSEGKSNFREFIAARGIIRAKYPPEEIAQKGYLHPEKLPVFPKPNLHNSKKKSGLMLPKLNGSRSIPQHDLPPIVEIPDQETNPCDKNIVTEVEIIRKAIQEAAAQTKSKGTRHVSLKSKTSMAATTGNTEVEHRSISTPATVLTKEEVSRQAAGAKPVAVKVSENEVRPRVITDFVIGNTSYTLRNDVTQPKLCTSVLTAGLLEEATKVPQDDRSNAFRFSQQPTLQQIILKQPLYTFVSNSEVASVLPDEPAKENMESPGETRDQRRRKVLGGLKNELKYPENPENPRNLENLQPPNELDKLQHLQHLQHLNNLENPNNLRAFSNLHALDPDNNEWEDYTGNNSSEEEEFDPSWFLERPANSAPITI